MERSRVALLRSLPTQQWRTPPRPSCDGDGGEGGGGGSGGGGGNSGGGGSVADGSGGPEECSLCLEAFAPGETVRRLPCLHLFHKRCIDRWLLVSQRHRDRSCPLCKMDPLAPLQLAALQPEADETGSSSGAGAGAGATPGPAACVRSPLLPPRRVSTLPSRLDGAWGP